MAAKWRIDSVETFDGPNLALPCRAVRARLSLDAAALGREQRARLMRLLDGLRRRRNDPPGDAFAAMTDAAGLVPCGEAVATTAVELQRAFGDDVALHSAAAHGQAGRWDIAVAWERPGLGLPALETAAALVAAVAAGAGQVPAEVDRFVVLAVAGARDSMLAPLIRGARAKGLPVERLNDSNGFLRHLRFGHGCHQRQTLGTISDATSSVATSLAGSKRQTVLALDRLGVPVPRQVVIRTIEQARQAARLIGFPVVVKPDSGTGGRGITAGVRDDAELAAAFARAQQGNARVVVEEFLPGEDHRLLVCGGRLVTTTQRRRAQVVGDGHSTIAALIAAVNADPRRGPRQVGDLITLEIDDAMVEQLARHNLKAHSVPRAGETVLLRTTANIKSGGTPVDVDALVHPDNRRLAETVAASLRLDFVGIDLMIPDIGRSYLEQRCGVIEVNISPGIDVYGAIPGLQTRVVGAILDVLFPPGTPAAMPLVVVLGTDSGDAPEIVGALANRLIGAGLQPAWFDGKAVRIGLETHRAGIADAAVAAAMILAHPGAGAGILLCSRDHVRHRGLPWERCDVVVGVGREDLDVDSVVVGAAGGRFVSATGARPGDPWLAMTMGALGLGG